jgi:hypothetical protein
MAASRRLVRFAVLGPVAGAVLVLNLRCGAFGGPRFGEREMKAAVEGTWQLTIGEPTASGPATGERIGSGQAGERGGGGIGERAGGEQIVTFRIEQGRKARHAGARSALVQSAEACGTRSLVRAAEACVDVTRMPLDVTLIAGADARRAEVGEMIVFGDDFKGGRVEVPLGEIAVTAQLSARGEVLEVREDHSSGAHTRDLPLKLVRIAR